jgi:hypothetical protein
METIKHAHSPTYPSLQPSRKIRILSTVRQFAAKYPAFSPGSLRHLIFFSKDRCTAKGTIPANGIERALVRVGRKLLIDDAKFFEWIEQKQSEVESDKRF